MIEQHLVEAEEVTTVSSSNPHEVVKKTTKVAPSPIKTEPPQRVYDKKKVIFRTYQIVWYILGVIEILLAFRLVLKMLGANPYSGFTYLIYSLSDPLALPFRGILSTPVSGTSVFETTTLIAGLVYAIIAYGIVYLLQIVKPVDPEEVEETVDNP